MLGLKLNHVSKEGHREYTSHNLNIKHTHSTSRRPASHVNNFLAIQNNSNTQSETESVRLIS